MMVLAMAGVWLQGVNHNAFGFEMSTGGGTSSTPPTTGTPVTTNSSVPVPPGLVSWWRGEGDAKDAYSTNDGVLTEGVSFAAGEVGQAFCFTNAGQALVVPASASLDVGAGDGFTLEAWINPSDNLGTYPIFEWNTGSSWGVHFYVADGQPGNPNSGPAELYANVVDHFGGAHQLSSAGGVVASNVFQHVALTYDKTSGAATIYYNGQMVSQANIGAGMIPSTSYDLWIGYRPSNEHLAFPGLIDEPSIYNRALTSGEITSIYQAGQAGKTNAPTAPHIYAQPVNQVVGAGDSVAFAVGAVGTWPLSYQWSFKGSKLSGATNAWLTLTNVHVSQTGNYAVKVSNSYGTITSSNVWLSVVGQTNLIYSYSGNEQVVTAGVDFNYAYSGELFYTPATTNFVFVGWGKPNGKRQYWVSAATNWLWLTVSGRGGQSYTVLGQAGTYYDNNSQPHVWSYLHKGLNARLTIGRGKYFTFPSTLSYNSLHVYPDLQSTNLILRDATSSYSYQSGSTQAANDGGKNLADLIADLKASLIRQGYQAQ